MNRILLFVLLLLIVSSANSCKSNKITCPTYSDGGGQSGSPKMSKPQKPKSGVLPPGK
jgi:hypothetical protein